MTDLLPLGGAVAFLAEIRISKYLLPGRIPVSTIAIGLCLNQDRRDVFNPRRWDARTWDFARTGASEGPRRSCRRPIEAEQNRVIRESSASPDLSRI